MPKGTYDICSRVDWIQEIYLKALEKKMTETNIDSTKYFGRTGPISFLEWIKLWFRGEGRLWLLRTNEHVRKIVEAPTLVVFKIDKTWNEFLG